MQPVGLSLMTAETRELRYETFLWYFVIPQSGGILL